MSRIAVLNIILGAVASSLVTILIVLETTDDPPPPTTTTTSTTTTTVPPSTTTTTTTTTTTSTTTTTTSTTTIPPTTEVPVDRFFVAVVVVNGTSTGELIEPVRSRLRNAGYGFVRGMSGVVPTQNTVLYALDESFIGEAEVVAQDLGFELDDIEILLFEDAPPVSGILDAKVIVYLGPDPLPEP